MIKQKIFDIKYNMIKLILEKYFSYKEGYQVTLIDRTMYGSDTTCLVYENKKITIPSWIL